MWSLGFRVMGAGCRDEASGSRLQVLGFGVQDLGVIFRVQGS